MLMLGAATLPALARTSWNADEAQGQVGTIEVQRALGWTARELQAKAGLVQFRVFARIEETWGCATSDAVETHHRVLSIGGAVRDEPDVRGRAVVGFAMQGYAEPPTAVVLEGGDGGCPVGSEYQDDLTQTQVSFAYDVSTDGAAWFPIVDARTSHRSVGTHLAI